MSNTPPASTGTGKGAKLFWKRLMSQKVLLFMSLPFAFHLIIFKYIPIAGWVMAFQNYKPGRSWAQQKWVGLDQFKALFSDSQFYLVLRNTLAMAGIKLILGTLFSILVAILIHETHNKPFKRSVQTISYLPHFISWVVAANIVLEFLSPRGPINGLLLKLGLIEEAILFMGKPQLFWWIIGSSHVWKTAGFGAIIYLAAMTGIDPQLYDAAQVDGANRMQRIRHITLPGIQATVVILLIMNIGHILDAGFEQQYLLQNGLVQDYSEVMTIFVLKYGLKMQRFSFAVAAGIFRSMVSIILIFTANKIAGRLGQETLL